MNSRTAGEVVTARDAPFHALTVSRRFLPETTVRNTEVDRVIQTTTGRRIGIAEYGDPNGAPVLWCHGGPGSRLEPSWLSDSALAGGLRIIGVDRPGYGLSDPRPGRSILDVVDDVYEVVYQLSLDRFATVGVSTGGTYALAVAAAAPARAWGVILAGAMTDMAYEPARETMSRPHAHDVWNAPDRAAALAAAVAAHGENGEKMTDGNLYAALPPADQAMLRDAEWARHARAGLRSWFAHGLEGYTDDRIADGNGWSGFDVSRITCPVVILQGTDDIMTRPIHGRHTASIVPTATLRLLQGHGHFSVESLIVSELATLLNEVSGRIAEWP